MPVPHPSPDARRRRKWRRRLFRVTIGGTIPVLVSSSAAPIRTTTIRRSVIAPLFENAVSIVQTALRRRSGSTADQQQGAGYKFCEWLHKPLRCLLLFSSQLVGAVRVSSRTLTQRHGLARSSASVIYSRPQLPLMRTPVFSSPASYKNTSDRHPLIQRALAGTRGWLLGTKAI